MKAGSPIPCTVVARRIAPTRTPRSASAIAAASLRSVEHRGGLDAFLLKAHDDDLSVKTRALKREIAKKRATAAAETPAAA